VPYDIGIENELKKKDEEAGMGPPEDKFNDIFLLTHNSDPSIRRFSNWLNDTVN